MNEELSYGGFANVYDLLTEDVEYEKRIEYILKLIHMHLGKAPDFICDLGCGTGTVCSGLAEKGYECIGIDSSENMLSVARQKDTDNKILYLLQDITSFELYGTVDVFLSMLDTLNYITDADSIAELFALIKNYLNPGGIFIFDVNTRHKFENILGNNTYVYEKGDVFYTWENYYEEDVLEFFLNFFVKNKDGNYVRFSEEHVQRYYPLSFLTECAEKYDLKVVGVYSDLTTNDPNADDERIFIVLKK